MKTALGRSSSGMPSSQAHVAATLKLKPTALGDLGFLNPRP